MPLDEAKAKGLVEMFDPKPPYLEHIGDLIDLERLRNAGLTRAWSIRCTAPAWATSATSCRGGKTQVHEIRGEINPAFPGMHNPEPIPRNLDATVAAVREFGAQTWRCARTATPTASA